MLPVSFTANCYVWSLVAVHVAVACCLGDLIWSLFLGGKTCNVVGRTKCGALIDHIATSKLISHLAKCLQRVFGTLRSVLDDFDNCFEPAWSQPSFYRENKKGNAPLATSMRRTRVYPRPARIHTRSSRSSSLSHPHASALPTR
jgi:hypothetical protein